MSTIEYENIYDDAINKIDKNDVDDVYTEIMTKEKITLDILKRLKEKKNETEIVNNNVMNSTVNNVIYKTFKTMLDIYNDILSGKSFKNIFKLERRIYIGIFLIFFSVCFIILYKV